LERKNGDLLKEATKIFSQVYHPQPKCNNLNSIITQGKILCYVDGEHNIFIEIEEPEEPEEGIEYFIETKSVDCSTVARRMDSNSEKEARCSWKEEIFCEFSCGVCKN